MGQRALVNKSGGAGDAGRRPETGEAAGTEALERHESGEEGPVPSSGEGPGARASMAALFVICWSGEVQQGGGARDERRSSEAVARSGGRRRRGQRDGGSMPRRAAQGRGGGDLAVELGGSGVWPRMQNLRVEATAVAWAGSCLWAVLQRQAAEGESRRR